MPSKRQTGSNNKDYPSEIDRQIAEWPDEWLLKHIPMTQKVAKNYWNAVNRQECSERVYEHFREELDRFR